MATYQNHLILLINLLSSLYVAKGALRNDDVIVATREMQKANYFSFVMLLKMVPLDRLPDNVTFLMPHDRTLSKISIPENAVGEFLSRHSIPSPLLFDYLEHFPTGSLIPASKQNFMLQVSNGGRRSFRLNNVRITSPNICTAVMSIRCHGIDGVLLSESEQNTTTLPSPTCISSPNNGPAATASPPPSPPSSGTLNLVPSIAPMPINFDTRSKKSGCSRLLASMLLASIRTCVILALVTIPSIGDSILELMSQNLSN